MFKRHRPITNTIFVMSGAYVWSRHAVDIQYGLGPSMEPELPNGCLIIIDRMSRSFRKHRRGDVVLLESPCKSRGETMCKRILAIVREKALKENGMSYGVRL